MPKTPSSAAIDLLKTFEKGPKGGFAAWPYVCPAGKQTIGWGHVIRPQDRIRPPLSKDQADALLQADLNGFALDDDDAWAARHYIPLAEISSIDDDKVTSQLTLEEIEELFRNGEQREHTEG